MYTNKYIDFIHSLLPRVFLLLVGGASSSHLALEYEQGQRPFNPVSIAVYSHVMFMLYSKALGSTHSVKMNKNAEYSVVLRRSRKKTVRTQDMKAYAL